MKPTLRWFDYVSINIYFLGLSTLSQTMAPLVMPLLVQQYVGEALKATYYGNLRLWGLMVALLAQALWGLLSDRSTLRWGRRRPYILIGTLADLVFIAAIAFSAGLTGFQGYWFLFAMYLMLQISSNMAQGAQQALIPDLVPEERRGLFSAIKAVCEVPLPVILISFVIGRLIGAGQLTAGIVAMVVVLVGSMLLAMGAREQPLATQLPPLDWTPLARLALMTALFTVVILALGQVTVLAGHLLQGIDAVPVLMMAMGASGLIAMGIAIALGVSASVRVSIGSASREHPSFTWWVVNRLAFLAAIVNLSSFFVYFLQARLSLEREKAAGPAANLLMVIGIFILVFALAGGWLADRYGAKRIVAIAGGIAFAGTVIAILAPDLMLIYLGGCLIGTAAGLFYTANWALGTALVPPDQAGRYLGISNLAGAGAGAIGSYIGGPIADYMTVRVPTAPGLGYVLLFAIYGALFLLSIVALRRVHPPAVPAATAARPVLVRDKG